MDHQEKIYHGFQYAMVDCDEEFLEEYAEHNLCKRVQQSVNNQKEKGYTLKVVEDVIGNYGEQVPSTKKIIDAVMVRGLYVDREKNGSEDNYHIFIDREEMGVVVYTNKKISDPENFINPDDNKTIYDDQRHAVGRVLMKFKSPLVVKVFTKEGREVKVEGQENTWTHIGIFESDLIQPGKFKSKYKLEGYVEWLSKFKPGKWQITDIDNYMLGNPLVRERSRHDKFDENIFKESKFDREANIDLRNT